MEGIKFRLKPRSYSVKNSPTKFWAKNHVRLTYSGSDSHLDSFVPTGLNGKITRNSWKGSQSYRKRTSRYLLLFEVLYV